MLRIVLIFHSTRNDNMGVGALTVSQIAILQAIAKDRKLDLEIVVIDSKDPRKPYVSDPSVDIREMRELRNLAGVYKIYRDADMVIDIGAGDSFSDIYGGRRLFRLLVLKYLALLARRPLVLAPQTMGPFKQKKWARASVPVISRSDVVATRDTMSTDYLRGLGIGKEIVEASDVALKLPYDAPVAPAPNGPKRIGLNISGLLMNGGYTGANQFGLAADYPRLARDIISGFLAHPDDCEVHLVPHVISHHRGAIEDDYQASVDLAAEFDGVLVAPAFKSPSEAKSYIAGMDFFLGARMHACIAAFSSGVPVVPMAYSRKFAGLFGSLGYEQTVDCTSDGNDAILASVFSAYERRGALKEDMLRALDLGLAKLQRYETAVGDLMEQVARR